MIRHERLQTLMGCRHVLFTERVDLGIERGRFLFCKLVSPIEEHI